MNFSLWERYHAGPRCKKHSAINTYLRRNSDGGVTRECVECDHEREPKQQQEPLVDWWYSMGRCYLTVAGYVVAVEGDVVRDPDLMMLNIPGDLRRWTPDLIKHVAAKANGGKLPT